MWGIIGRTDCTVSLLFLKSTFILIDPSVHKMSENICFSEVTSSNIKSPSQKTKNIHIKKLEAMNVSQFCLKNDLINSSIKVVLFFLLCPPTTFFLPP